MKKEVNIDFRGKKVELVFNSERKSFVEVFCVENDFYGVIHSIDLSEVIKCLLFEDTCFIDGEWSEKTVKELFEVVE